MSFLLLLVGWLSLISGNIIWIGHGVYQLSTTDLGFFTVVAANFLGWFIQMALGIIALAIGYYKFK